MSKPLKYHHDRREYLVLALDTIVDNLIENLRITESVSTDMDTFEEEQKLNELLVELGQPPMTDDEVSNSLSARIDETTARFGHIQKRIDQVRETRRRIDVEAHPNRAAILHAYATVRNALLFETTRLFWLSPKVSDQLGWSEERLKEDERARKSVHVCAQALAFTFNLFPPFWPLAPFDEE